MIAAFIGRGALAGLLLLGPAATDLRITDSQGTSVVVSGASIDYSGMVSPDKETEGIRLQQGDGTVLLKWTDLESLRLVPSDSGKPPRVEVQLRNGKKVTAALLRKGQMKLSGKSDLGDYVIDVEKVRAIAPVR